jgi:hypothetical protein
VSYGLSERRRRARGRGRRRKCEQEFCKPEVNHSISGTLSSSSVSSAELGSVHFICHTTTDDDNDEHFLSLSLSLSLSSFRRNLDYFCLAFIIISIISALSTCLVRIGLHSLVLFVPVPSPSSPLVPLCRVLVQPLVHSLHTDFGGLRFWFFGISTVHSLPHSDFSSILFHSLSLSLSLHYHHVIHFIICRSSISGLIN